MLEVCPQALGLLLDLNAGKYHLVPEIFSFGSLMYSFKVSSFHAIPEFLLAQQQNYKIKGATLLSDGGRALFGFALGPSLLPPAAHVRGLFFLGAFFDPTQVSLFR